MNDNRGRKPPIDRGKKTIGGGCAVIIRPPGSIAWCANAHRRCSRLLHFSVSAMALVRGRRHGTHAEIAGLMQLQVNREVWDRCIVSGRLRCSSSLGVARCGKWKVHPLVDRRRSHRGRQIAAAIGQHGRAATGEQRQTYQQPAHAQVVQIAPFYPFSRHRAPWRPPYRQATVIYVVSRRCMSSCARRHA
jgi:hypothetical protein